jgi:hypothetical protein
MYLVLFHEFSLPCSHACLMLLFVLNQFTFDLASKVNMSMGAESWEARNWDCDAGCSLSVTLEQFWF